jgi:hypothetical protein
MEIFEFYGEDFKAVLQFEGWKIGILRYSDRFSDFKVMERHLETDEAFVLLEGEATLFEEENTYKMEKYKVYNVKKGLWHHIVVSKDATVLVVENSNTTKENTERKYL